MTSLEILENPWNGSQLGSERVFFKGENLLAQAAQAAKLPTPLGVLPRIVTRPPQCRPHTTLLLPGQEAILRMPRWSGQGD